MKKYKNVSGKEICVNAKMRKPEEEFATEETQETKNLVKAEYLKEMKELKKKQ